MAKKLFFILTCLVLVSCANPRPFEYHKIDEIPEGPGLFSGEKGEIILYSK